jgi:hypothetical protein
MKNPSRPSSAIPHARTIPLTPQHLSRVLGGTGGTIIVENVVALPHGIQGTGHN